MSKSIAILYDCPFPFVQGGGQRRLFEIAQVLLAEGWRVEWYALKFWQGPDVLEYEGILYRAVGRGVTLYSSDGKRRIAETLYYGWKILQQGDLRHFDILHAGQWPFLHLIPARLFSLCGGAKLVVDWWEVWGKDLWIDYFGFKGILGLLLEKLLARMTPHIIAITQKGKEQLQQLGVKSSRITFISNGIDFEKIQKGVCKGKEFDLVYMGRLKNHKNVSHILQAMGILKKKGRSLTLQIIGDGPDRESLEKLAQHLGMTQNIIFHGMIESDEEAYAKMKASRIFIYPSTKGSASIMVMEANACGLPVMAYRTEYGLSPELIEEGVNGFWVEGSQPQAMADTLEKLFSNSGEAINYDNNVIEFAQKYAWKNIGKIYNDYFLDLIKNR